MPDHNWPAEQLSDDGKHEYYKAAIRRYESAESDTRTIRTQSLIFGAGGMLCGLLGIGAAFVTYQHAPQIPPPEYILVHDATGIVERATTAKDAAPLFGEATRRRELREFLVACEGYIPQTFAALDFHACMIRATPKEQERRSGEIGKGGTRYPPEQFDWAMPVGEMTFVNKGQVDGSFHYQIRYKRIEATGAHQVTVAWTGDIVFSFHPTIKMTEADRTLNPTGLQVESFSTTKD